jgi:biopolymer transport protein TolQ
VNNKLNLIEMLAHASFPVLIVMALLLAASVWSWWMIFRKKSALSAAMTEAQAFEDRFWSGVDLAQLYKEVSHGGQPQGLAGEFAKLRARKNIDPRVMLEGAQRAMRVALTREVEKLESHLTNLATIGSISPYIGLFGTVWGILLAFQGLGSVQSATIAMVAPGISEALIATAMGLFAAIPAVIFYNRFSNQVDRVETRYDTFQDEFSSILQRQANIEDHGH